MEIDPRHPAVTVDTAHPLAGSSIVVRNDAWLAGAVGSTPCECVGYVPASRKYVLKASDDGNCYLFTPTAIALAGMSDDSRALL